MTIRAISIIGEGEFRTKLHELFSGADFTVTMSGVREDYAEQAADADLILEVIDDDIAVKKEVFRRCEAGCREQAILATTTAGPWVTEIAGTTRRPERVVGLCFTENPFDEKHLVQIVRGLQTTDDTVRVLKELLEQVGITAVELEETPGFILDRVIASVVNEAALMYTTKLATLEDIDQMMKVCANWPMGPFEFADTIGVDRIVGILESLSHQFGSRYLPCFLLRKMVDAGWLGKNTGRGFYVYS
jgi:3-hydroxybutyryl-CoA dehydrogenase